MKRLDFTEWLATQIELDSPVGDLARDAGGDKAWPVGKWLPHAAFEEHLEQYGRHVTQALDVSWLSWSRETRILGDAESFVYFVLGTETDRVKIGFAKDPKDRLATLQTGASEALEILLAVPGTRADESRLHVFNAAHRITGEWFHRSDDIECQLRASALALAPVVAGFGGVNQVRHALRLRWCARRTEHALLTGANSRFGDLEAATEAARESVYEIDTGASNGPIASSESNDWSDA